MDELAVGLDCGDVDEPGERSAATGQRQCQHEREHGNGSRQRHHGATTQPLPPR